MLRGPRRDPGNVRNHDTLAQCELLAIRHRELSLWQFEEYRQERVVVIPMGIQLPIVSLLAIAAVLCIGIGDALRLGEYSTASIVLVLLGVVLVWSASRLGRGRLLVSERNTRIAVGLAFEVLFVADLWFRGGLSGRAAPRR